MSDFRMPSLGADMEAGTLVEWHIHPGDEVKRGQVVALVETAKGIVEVEIWQAGKVAELVVAPGTKVPVGTVLATLDGGAAAPSQPVATEPARIPTPTAPASSPIAAAPEHVRASPAARKRARDLGVELAKLTGTGPHGAITIGDVEQAAKTTAPTPPAPPPAAAKPDAIAAMRQAIAAAMARSKREIPHYYLATDVDLSRALAHLEAENARRPVTERVLLAALELKAVALALREVPELNGLWIDGALRTSERIHLGVAISLRHGGLVAPAIHDADRRSVAELMADLSDLTRRARAGTLRSSEMTGPTITVTNLGEQGVETVYGVIYPPQVALVGLGKPTERPFAEHGMLGVRTVLTATLSADHRATDGHRGAQLLSAFSRLLQEPEKL